eukprot:scaffold63831_cov41-Phaeocystis_antarctica.AAC.2
MIPQLGSVTEPLLAPNTAAVGSGSRACNISAVSDAAVLVGELMTKLTASTPFPSVSTAETSMSEGSTGAPEPVRIPKRLRSARSGRGRAGAAMDVVGAAR